MLVAEPRVKGSVVSIGESEVGFRDETSGLIRGVVTSCSVVMATYNGARFLSEQLDSIRNQDTLPDELIVSDDGSTDETLDIVSDFRRRAPFHVKVLRGPGCGYAENFWSAAALASCETIAWSDQDDVWHPEKLSSSLRVLQDTQVAMVSHSAALVGPSLKPLGGMYPGYQTDTVLEPLQGQPLAVPPGFVSTFRRTLLKQVRWSTRPLSHQLALPLGHDHAIALVTFAGHRRAQQAAVLARHRQHGANVAGDPTERKLRQLLTGLRTPASDYEQLGDYMYGYASWVGESGFDDAARYYRTIGDRAYMRTGVRRADTGRRRLLCWMEAAEAGVYRPIDQGGFGRMAMANDVAAAILGAPR
jgi:glycosyltransferase involved in cell wall biosynthesis